MHYQLHNEATHHLHWSSPGNKRGGGVGWYGVEDNLEEVYYHFSRRVHATSIFTCIKAHSERTGSFSR